MFVSEAHGPLKTKSIISVNRTAKPLKPGLKYFDSWTHELQPGSLNMMTNDINLVKTRNETWSTYSRSNLILNIVQVNYMLACEFLDYINQLPRQPAQPAGPVKITFSEHVVYGMKLGLKWCPAGVNLTPPAENVKVSYYDKTRVLVHFMQGRHEIRAHNSTVYNSDHLHLVLKFKKVRNVDIVQKYHYSKNECDSVSISHQMSIANNELYIPQFFLAFSVRQNLESTDSQFEVENKQFSSVVRFVGIVYHNPEYPNSGDRAKRARLTTQNRSSHVVDVSHQTPLFPVGINLFVT